MAKAGSLSTVMSLSLIVMFIAGCGGGVSDESASMDRPLEGTHWTLTRMDGAEVLAAQKQREAHLVFEKEGTRVAGSGGCNRIMGKYTLQGESLSFSQIAGTMMACPNMGEEQQFLNALGRVDSHSIKADKMDMSVEDKVVLEFAAQAK